MGQWYSLRRQGPATHAGTIDPDYETGPPLAHLKGLTQIRRCLPSCGVLHHFFPSRSFNAALSNMASASIHFSRLFSFSSAFSRLASETRQPSKLRLPFVEAR